MKIRYDEGPDSVKMGSYAFRRGEAQEVPDDIAEALLKKESIKFTAVTTIKNKQKEE